MTEMFNELVRTKTGLYNLKISTAEGTVLNVDSITRAQAYRLIEETEKKMDRGRER